MENREKIKWEEFRTNLEKTPSPLGKLLYLAETAEKYNIWLNISRTATTIITYREEPPEYKLYLPGPYILLFFRRGDFLEITTYTVGASKI